MKPYRVESVGGMFAAVLEEEEIDALYRFLKHEVGSGQEPRPRDYITLDGLYLAVEYAYRDIHGSQE